eukprot:15478717-Alexandrium_andersonii.AAC.1
MPLWQLPLFWVQTAPNTRHLSPNTAANCCRGDEAPRGKFKCPPALSGPAGRLSCAPCFAGKRRAAPEACIDGHGST